MAYQSQDIIRRSATNGLTPAPQARDFQEEVAKLITLPPVSAVKPVRWRVQSGTTFAIPSAITLGCTTTPMI